MSGGSEETKSETRPGGDPRREEHLLTDEEGLSLDSRGPHAAGKGISQLR